VKSFLNLWIDVPAPECDLLFQSTDAMAAVFRLPPDIKRIGGFFADSRLFAGMHPPKLVNFFGKGLQLFDVFGAKGLTKVLAPVSNAFNFLRCQTFNDFVLIIRHVGIGSRNGKCAVPRSLTTVDYCGRLGEYIRFHSFNRCRIEFVNIRQPVRINRLGVWLNQSWSFLVLFNTSGANRLGGNK